MNIYWKLSGFFMKLARQIERIGGYFFIRAIEEHNRKEKK
jgi:hypothetical protein